MNSELILAIESSCDDTAVAVLRGTKVLSNITASQAIHADYGGVVPELASRSHQQNIVPVLLKALSQANIRQNDLNAIAVTRGPGLLGSLLVGLSFAKSLSLSLTIPLIEVNHLQAHILAHFIEGANENGAPEFPFLCLTVSGGHTLLVIVRDFFDIEIIGSTLDDAAGEALDKIGKLLGLDYPAGAEIDRLARCGNPLAFRYNRPKIEGFNFSFSGIKTSVLYSLNKEKQNNPDFIQQNLYDICASAQQTILDTLMDKLIQAAEHYKIKNLAIAGGVSANSKLREMLNNLTDYQVFIPEFSYTTDNAAMIGLVGYLKFKRKEFASLDLSAQAKYPLNTI